MKLYDDIIYLSEFTPWSGAKYNYELIIKSGNDYDFISAIEEIYPEGLTETELNDILWFDDEFCYQYIDNEYLDDDQLEIKSNY